MAAGEGSGSGGSPNGAGLPIGVERALARATEDPVFRAALRERGAGAAVDAGIALTTAERAVLDGIDGTQLDQMVEHLAGRVVEIPPPEAAPVPAGIRPGDIATLGTRPGPIAPQGIRPDPVPDARQDVLPGSPDRVPPDPTRGIRPDSGMVKGIRPGIPIALAAGAVVVGGFCVTAYNITAGVRPDDLPEPEPAEPQAPGDEALAGSGPDGGAADAGTEADGGDGGASSQDD